MDSWTAVGYLAMTAMLMGVGIAVGAALVFWSYRSQWLGSLKYVMDRLKKLEFDQRRADEEILLLRARLKQSGLLDEEDLAELRRELIELPRERKAEQLELLAEARRHGLAERVVFDTSETMQ